MENKSANLSKASKHCLCLVCGGNVSVSCDFLFASTWQPENGILCKCGSEWRAR